MGDKTLYEQISVVAVEDWKKLFALIPRFESASSFGEFIIPDPDEEGVMQFPYVSSDDLINDFVKICYEINIVLPFNWSAWEDAYRIIEEERFGQEDLLTMCKLITFILRKDRFSEGTLLSLCESGDVLDILKRMKEIVDEI